MFRKQSKPTLTDAVTTSLDFYSHLKWLDGRPLLDTMAEYRRELHTAALDTFDENGLPAFNFVLSGRAKKNDKTTDIALAALYKLVIPASIQGNDGFLIANDEDQAGDDLDLIKKLIAVNPMLRAVLFLCTANRATFWATTRFTDTAITICLRLWLLILQDATV
jgi:hypothetical protein